MRIYQALEPCDYRRTQLKLEKHRHQYWSRRLVGESQVACINWQHKDSLKQICTADAVGHGVTERRPRAELPPFSSVKHVTAPPPPSLVATGILATGCRSCNTALVSRQLSHSALAIQFSTRLPSLEWGSRVAHPAVVPLTAGCHSTGRRL